LDTIPPPQILSPNLIPVLDEMTWPEEIAVLPPDYHVGGGPTPATFLLLADVTNFYFYEFDGDALSKAGTTLEDVFEGMKGRKWWPTAKEPWEDVEDNGEEYDHYDYFPFWMVKREKDGTWAGHVLVDTLWLFVPHLRPMANADDEGLDKNTPGEDAEALDR
jgi:hypothetical protein